MRIRKAVVGYGDRDRILQADLVCFPDDRRLGTELRRGSWWLLMDGDRVAGYCGMRLLSGESDIWYLTRAGVVPEYRGRRLQQRMIRHRLRAARAVGAEAVVTYTVWENPASSNSLIACGFRMYAPPIPWVGSALYWQRRF